MVIPWHVNAFKLPMAAPAVLSKALSLLLLMPCFLLLPLLVVVLCLVFVCCAVQ